jgi:hypothetical protein
MASGRFEGAKQGHGRQEAAGYSHVITIRHDFLKKIGLLLSSLLRI